MAARSSNLKLADLPAPPSAPPRSPERDALARAIERYGAAQLASAGLAAAAQASWTFVGDASRAVEAATAALAVAKTATAEAAVRALLEPARAAPPPSTQPARQALAEAEERLGAAEAAKAALPAKRSAAGMELGFARSALVDCMRDVVRSEAATAALVADYIAAARRFEELLATMRFLEGKGMVPPAAAGSLLIDMERELPDDAPWRAAIAGLSSDADTRLP